MKKIIVLQNGNVHFDLEAKRIYQPEKYKLYLIVNEFSFNLVNQCNQNKYYAKILVTNDFIFENILSLILTCLEKNEEFDIITNSEGTMPICGQLRVYFGLQIEDYSRFYNKHIMKMKLSNNNHALIPKYKLFNTNIPTKKNRVFLENLVKDLNFPLFIKPVQSYSSMNLKKINNYDELFQWSKTTSINSYYEIDEFIEGTMYHCDSYIKDEKILFTFVSQNSRPCYDFTIGKIKGTIVLPPSHPDAIRLSEITRKTLNQLGMPKGGVTHLELIKTKDDIIYFVEIAHRSPGCLIPKMYKEHANIDTITSHFLLQIDTDYQPIPNRGIFAAWLCYPKIPGTVTELEQLPSHLKSKCEAKWHVKIGDKIETYSKFGRDYTGTLFMTNPDFSLLYNEFEIMNNLNLCKIESIS